jgi:hypothetical protein
MGGKHLPQRTYTCSQSARRLHVFAKGKKERVGKEGRDGGREELKEGMKEGRKEGKGGRNYLGAAAISVVGFAVS